MRIIKEEIIVDGQLTGPAQLTGFLLDNISVAYEKLRPAIIVCAGGGYWRRSDRESEPVATQFLSMGYHAFLMDYSVAPNRFPTSLLELAQAVARIREQAGEWRIDPDKILVCGFSAAGHLACSLGVYWDKELVWGAIGRSPAQVKPNGMILCYPVITAGEYAHEGSILQLLGENPENALKESVSLERLVTEKTPRAFIWHTYMDDTVPLENSLLLAAQLRRFGVNFELHVYPTGRHGLSLANKETGGEDPSLYNEHCQSWLPLLKTWLTNL